MLKYYCNRCDKFWNKYLSAGHECPKKKIELDLTSLGSMNNAVEEILKSQGIHCRTQRRRIYTLISETIRKNEEAKR